MPFAVYRLDYDPAGSYPGPRTPIGVYPGDDREQAIADLGAQWDIEPVTEDQAEAIRAQLAPPALA